MQAEQCNRQNEKPLFNRHTARVSVTIPGTLQVIFFYPYNYPMSKHFDCPDFASKAQKSLANCPRSTAGTAGIEIQAVYLQGPCSQSLQEASNKKFKYS